jgi:predicted nucleic acid-binding protein
MILVDSSVWIDFFNGVDRPHVERFYQLLGNEIIATGDLIAVEVLQGFQKEADFKKAKKIMEEIPFFPLCNQEMSIIAAENYRTLRKNGVTVRKTIDVIIGTFCIEHNYKLLHHDRDFDPMEKILGLQVIR